MKLKKSISIILSGVIAANLACTYAAQASAKVAEDVHAEAITQNVVTNDEVLTVDKKEVARKAQPSNSHETHYEIDAHQALSESSRQRLIDKFILKNAKYFPKSKIRDLNSKLKKLNDEDIKKLSSISFHKPSHMTLLSVFFGQFGIDRMIIGKVGTGILKFLTGGGLGIWWLIDIFKIGKLTKQQNWEKLKEEVRDI